jgi:hypothetical protein
MPPKLSEKEKAVRGTAQRCRAREARSLNVIQSDMRELRRFIADQQYNLDIARKSVRTDGVLIDVLVANSNGRLETTRRLNPAFKVQASAFSALKSFRRQLEFLAEERDAARAKQPKAQDECEFKI